MSSDRPRLTSSGESGKTSVSALAPSFLAVAILFATSHVAAQDDPAPSPDAPSETAEQPIPDDADSGAERHDFDFGDDLYLGYDFSPGEAETTVYEELDDIFIDKEPVVDVRPLDAPFDAFRSLSVKIDEAIGLRIGIAYTMVFQQATGGKSGGGGDFDLFGTWDLVNRGKADTGRLVWAVENRHKIGGRVASDLRPALGTLLAPTNGFNDRGWAVRDFFWQQNLFKDRLRIIVGRADPTDYFGAHRLQNKNALFFNRHISGTAALPSPGHGLSLIGTLRPNELFFVSAGTSNAYGDTTKAEVESLFDEWDLFSFAEVGFTPKIEGLGQGRYTVSVFYVDPRDRGDQNLSHDSGFSFVLDQDIGENVQAFFRYNYTDKSLNNIKHLVQGGVGVSGLLGSSNNMTGLALSYADPDGPGRAEKVAEVFQRFQLTGFIQFSVGAQAIIDPTFAPDDDVIGVFSMRARVAF
jgi:porin